jgi:hypothetical protein
MKICKSRAQKKFYNIGPWMSGDKRSSLFRSARSDEEKVFNGVHLVVVEPLQVVDLVLLGVIAEGPVQTRLA